MSLGSPVQDPVMELQPLINIPKCQHATERPSFDDYGSVVNIVVGRGNTNRSFQVYAGLLQHYSSYFRSALKSTWLNGEISLYDDNPEVVQAFLHWLFSGKLYKTLPADGKIPLTFNDICSLFVFGDTRGIPELCNAAVDVLLQKFANEWASTIYCLNYTYSNTLAGSKLRNIIVDLAVNSWSFKGLDRDLDVYPKEFLADVILRSQELGNCPGALRNKERFLETRVAKLCTHFHDHSDPHAL